MNLPVRSEWWLYYDKWARDATAYEEMHAISLCLFGNGFTINIDPGIVHYDIAPRRAYEEMIYYVPMIQRKWTRSGIRRLLNGNEYTRDSPSGRVFESMLSVGEEYDTYNDEMDEPSPGAADAIAALIVPTFFEYDPKTDDVTVNQPFFETVGPRRNAGCDAYLARTQGLMIARNLNYINDPPQRFSLDALKAQLDLTNFVMAQNRRLLVRVSGRLFRTWYHKYSFAVDVQLPLPPPFRPIRSDGTPLQPMFHIRLDLP